MNSVASVIFLISSNYKNTQVTFSLPVRQKNMENIVRLGLKEVII